MAFNNQLSTETKDYLQDKKVPQLIEHLFHELAVAMPEDPLAFLSTVLEKQPKPRVALLGLPCCGKSTLAQSLSNKHQVPVISLERIVSQDSEARNALQSGGGNNNSALTSKLVASAATKAIKESGGFILDGFPRTRSEAIGLQSFGVLPSVVLHLDCDSNTAQQRVTGEMDSLTLNANARMYELNSAEVLDCYPEKALRHTIDANVAAEDILKQAEPLVAAAML